MGRVSQSLPRVYVIEEELGRCAVSGGADAATVYFTILNPSVRLHLTAQVFARPNATGAGEGGGGASHDYTGETWQLTVVVPGTPACDTNAVFTDPTTGVATPVNLPDTYEGETGAKQIRGVVELLAQDEGAAKMSYWVRCTWEPASGGERMSDLEWGDLTAACAVTPEGELGEVA